MMNHQPNPLWHGLEDRPQLRIGDEDHDARPSPHRRGVEDMNRVSAHVSVRWADSAHALWRSLEH